MADPLSTLAGILGACDVILRVFKATTEYVSDVKAAPKEFQQIRFEVQNLQAITAALGEFLKSEKVKDHGFPDNAPISKAIETCKDYVSELEKEFTAKSQRSRLLWPLFGKTEIKKTLQNLDRFTNLFHWALSINGWSFFSESMEKSNKIMEGYLTSYQNMIKLLQPFPEMHEEIGEIREHCTVLRSIIQVFTTDTIPEMSSDISKILENLEDIKLGMQMESSLAERKELLEWLSTEDFSQKHRDVSNARQEGTDTWIFDDPGFRQWVSSKESKTLWCRGIPGSGKTVVFGAMVDWLLERRSQENSAVGMVYLDYKSQSFHSTEKIFLGILKQLCQQTFQFPQVDAALRELKSRCLKEGDRRPKLDDCNELFKVISGCCTVFVCCDGLDELPDFCRLSVLKSLATLRQRCNIKDLLTSRDHVELIPRPIDLTEIRISATLTDLRTYLESRIESASTSCLGRRAKVSSHLREEVITTISSKAKGMFLLAELHIKELEDAITEREIKELLRKLPDEIDDHYGSYIERLKTQRQGSRALDAIFWIHSSFRPLSPEELLEALSIQDGDLDLDPTGFMTMEEVLNITGGLLVLDKESNTVRLVHETFQEFLHQVQMRLFPNGHLSVSKTLVTYFHFKSLDTAQEGFVSESKWMSILNELRSSHKLLNYALVYWERHVRCLGAQAFKTGLALANGISSSPLLLRCVPQTGISRKQLLNLEGFSALHIAALWNSEVVVKGLLAPGSHKDHNLMLVHRSGTGLTPLHLAAMNDNFEILKILCEAGIDLEAADSNGSTALHFAAAYSSHESLQYLLTRNSNRNGLVNLANNNLDTPLHIALQSGDQFSTVELLSSGANVEAATVTGQTPLHYAARYAPYCTEILLKYGASTKTTSRNGRQALLWACARGDTSTIKLLLQHGSDPKFKDVSGDGPLHLLAQASTEQLHSATALVNSGAELDDTDMEGWTALHHALKNRHFELAKALIGLGASVYIRSNNQKLPLQLAAASSDCPAELWAVLGNIDTKDQSGETVLHVVARAQNATEVENLIKHGADLNVQNHSGESPLHVAVSCYLNHRKSTTLHSRSDVVSLMLDYGAAVDIRTNGGLNPAHLAMKSLSIPILRMFRSHGVTFNSTFPNGTSFLEFAVQNADYPVIDALLRHTQEVNDPCLDSVVLCKVAKILFGQSTNHVKKGVASIVTRRLQTGSRGVVRHPRNEDPFRICSANCSEMERCDHIFKVAQNLSLLIQHATPSPKDKHWRKLGEMFSAWCAKIGTPLRGGIPLVESCEAAQHGIVESIQNPERRPYRGRDMSPARDDSWNDNASQYTSSVEDTNDSRHRRATEVAISKIRAYEDSTRNASLFSEMEDRSHRKTSANRLTRVRFFTNQDSRQL